MSSQLAVSRDRRRTVWTLAQLSPTMEPVPIYPRLERSPRPQRRRRPHYFLPVIAAAALILLLIGGGAYLLLGRSPHTQGGAAQASPSPSPSASASASPHLRHIAVPILMYHHIAPVRKGSSLLSVSPRELAAQLAYLQAHGYHVVTLQQLYDAWTKGASLPTKPVVLSFDDGYLDQYRYAAPLLRRYHDPAVLNLIVDNLGRALTPTMVKQMIAWGWEVDSHTITHRDLTKTLGRHRAPRAGGLTRPAAALPRGGGELLLLPGWRPRCGRGCRRAQGRLPGSHLDPVWPGRYLAALRPAAYRRLLG